jgi:DNA modification methylase
MNQAARVARRWVIAFTDAEGISLWRDMILAAGLDYVRACAWVKPDSTPQFTGDRPASGFEVFIVAHQPGRKKWNGGGKRNVYQFMREPGGGEHPTQKPVALMEALVRDFTDPGELILDPFSGSGTTGVAARRLGRRFIGWEMNPEYAAIARRRIGETKEQGDLFAPAAKAEQMGLGDL